MNKKFECYTANEVMDTLEISRSTVCNITKIVKKDDLENQSEKLEKYRGKYLVAFRGIYRNNFLADFFIDYLKRQEKIRDIKQDLKLIKESKISIDILGINALGPLHQGRERILDLLKIDGNVRILLLNPLSEAFKKREEKEELHNDIITGRLGAEYVASVGLCKDIINFSDFKNTFKVKVHSQTPKMALLISDGESETGSLNCNIYPKEKNVRGLMGSHKLHISKKFNNVHFTEYFNHFNELWDSADNVEEIESFIKKHNMDF